MRLVRTTGDQDMLMALDTEVKVSSLMAFPKPLKVLPGKRIAVSG